MPKMATLKVMMPGGSSGRTALSDDSGIQRSVP